MGKKKTCREPKHKPYGAVGTEPYCRPHDQCSVYRVDKGAKRMRLKEEMRKEPLEPEYDPQEYVPPCDVCDDQMIVDGAFCEACMVVVSPRKDTP